MSHRHIDKDDELISQINVIPLVDISLVLLIIFMVTANFLMSSFIKVDVPKVAYGKSLETQENISIAISSEGLIYLGDKPITVKELKNRLAELFKKNSELSVVLNVDKAADFNSVVSVIDALSGLGITRINIATVNET